MSSGTLRVLPHERRRFRIERQLQRPADPIAATDSASFGNPRWNPPVPAGNEHNVGRFLGGTGRDYASAGTPQWVTGGPRGIRARACARGGYPTTSQDCYGAGTSVAFKDRWVRHGAPVTRVVCPYRMGWRSPIMDGEAMRAGRAVGLRVAEGARWISKGRVATVLRSRQ